MFLRRIVLNQVAEELWCEPTRTVPDESHCLTGAWFESNLSFNKKKKEKACNTNLSEKAKLMLSKTVSVAGKATGKR